MTRDNLTIERLQEAVNALRVTVYYADSDLLGKGQALFAPAISLVPGIALSPDYYILHPDDLDTIRQQCPDVQFVHLRDYKTL